MTPAGVGCHSRAGIMAGMQTHPHRTRACLVLALAVLTAAAAEASPSQHCAGVPEWDAAYKSLGTWDRAGDEAIEFFWSRGCGFEDGSPVCPETVPCAVAAPAPAPQVSPPAPGQPAEPADPAVSDREEDAEPSEACDAVDCPEAQPATAGTDTGAACNCTNSRIAVGNVAQCTVSDHRLDPQWGASGSLLISTGVREASVSVTGIGPPGTGTVSWRPGHFCALFDVRAGISMEAVTLPAPAQQPPRWVEEPANLGILAGIAVGVVWAIHHARQPPASTVEASR